ncbi:MAG: ribonuclease G [Bacteroides sp. SM23_62_1]|nr:MAG: ribonuclease G [Bacteroides sp. SM23_62_1]
MSKESEKELIIDASSPEISIALLEDKQLVELKKEKSDPKYSVGDIYLGRVKKIMPGLNAAFVDIGYGKDAFLHYLDLGPQFNSLNKYLSLALSHKGRVIPMHKFKREQDIPKDGKISDILKAGQNVLVQIVKEPISTKGPRLSSEVSLAGRHLVLIPFSDKVSISQKIESDEERNRLKRLLLSIRPKNFGTIVRTVAEDKKVAVLDSELRGLVKKWEMAFENLHGTHPPKLVISEINRTTAIVRDILNVSFNSIYINDKALFLEMKDYISTIAPEKKKILKLFSGSEPIFEKYGINKQIKLLFGRTVSFKNGAYMIIEHTEALHVIDVNSGNRSKSMANQETNALEVNLAAAKEIARQLRLRDMGGIIVVDFIDMISNEHKNMLFEKMKEAMDADRTKHNILPLSKFGLMQITRQRVRPEMNIDVSEKCPSCEGTGKISPSIMFPEKLMETIRTAVEQFKLKKLTIHVHPFIEAYLNRGVFPIIRKWGKETDCRITAKPETSQSLFEIRMFTSDGEEIPL